MASAIDPTKPEHATTADKAQLRAALLLRLILALAVLGLLAPSGQAHDGLPADERELQAWIDDAARYAMNAPLNLEGETYELTRTLVIPETVGIKHVTFDVSGLRQKWAIKIVVTPGSKPGMRRTNNLVLNHVLITPDGLEPRHRPDLNGVLVEAPSVSTMLLDVRGLNVCLEHGENAWIGPHVTPTLYRCGYGFKTVRNGPHQGTENLSLVHGQITNSFICGAKINNDVIMHGMSLTHQPCHLMITGHRPVFDTCHFEDKWHRRHTIRIFGGTPYFDKPRFIGFKPARPRHYIKGFGRAEIENRRD